MSAVHGYLDRTLLSCVVCHEMATGKLGETTQSAELLSCKCKEHLDSEHMPDMIVCLDSQYRGGRYGRIPITS